MPRVEIAAMQGTYVGDAAGQGYIMDVYHGYIMDLYHGCTSPMYIPDIYHGLHLPNHKPTMMLINIHIIL